jgi:hypothetical protein
MKIRDILTEGSGDDIKQMIADIQSGQIKPQIVQAVKNFMAKKLGAEAEQEPEQRDTQPPTQEPAEPVQQPVARPQAAKPVQQPQSRPVAPVAGTIKPQAPTAVSEAQKKKPAEPAIDVDADFEKILRTKFAADADNILTFVYRTNIQKTCDDIVVNKMFKSEAAELLYTLFYEAPGSLHDRNAIAIVIRDHGVLDLSKFDQAGEGPINELVQAKYRNNPLVQYLVEKLLNRKDFPTQVSSANKGAGEDMITILGNPVLKLSPGDLNVGGKEVEVKAQGARLKGFGGGRIYGNGATVYREWATAIASALGAKGMSVLNEYGLSLKNYLNFGDKTLAVLSQALAEGNGKNKQAVVKNAFESMLEHVYPQSTAKLRKTITGLIKSNGSFDVESFRRAWFLFSYEYYKLTTQDEKTGKAMDSIMFIHQPTSSYKFVISAKDFDFDKFTIDTSIYNWTDAPSVAPKITYGKEIRSRRSRAKAQ